MQKNLSSNATTNSKNSDSDSRNNNADDNAVAKESKTSKVSEQQQPKDPRHKNIWFNDESISAYFQDYQSHLNKALSSVSLSEMEKAALLMEKVAKSNNTFFVAGNGGSHAIAEHLCCDWTKGTYIQDQITLRTQSLNTNGPLFTAACNDFGYERALAYILQIQSKPGDALLVISSSGNSRNIIEAILTAQKLSLPVIALTGFLGGKARELADIKLHVDFSNYAVVEDAHQAVMQCLAQFFYSHNSKEKLKK